MSVRCVRLVVFVACLFVSGALFMCLVDSIVFVLGSFFSLFAFCCLLFRGAGFFVQVVVFVSLLVCFGTFVRFVLVSLITFFHFVSCCACLF